MYNYSKGSKVFSSGNISHVFSNINLFIKNRIEAETENYILNVNEIEYLKHLVNEYKIMSPTIHFDEAVADVYEDNIPAEYFPNVGFDVYSGQSYKRNVIQYIIPVTGDIKLLMYQPLRSMFVDGYFFVKGETVYTEYVDFYNDTAKVKADFDYKVRSLENIYFSLQKDILEFNSSLESIVSQVLFQTKQKYLDKNNFMSALGIPLRKTQNVSKTFSVPQPQLREKIVLKPTVIEKGFKPEPTLDTSTYNDILKLVNDVGKNFERLPSVYKDKHEEDLRDHILLILDPNFELGSASGETFNKSGKTDIQLRHDSSVIFIAECKFWTGEKGYLSTITQLLRYLTWRDTKAAIIIFVQQKDFSSVLKKVEEITNKHDNYLGYTAKSDENWFNYRFHINGDSNREVKVAVQLFHLPK